MARFIIIPFGLIGDTFGTLPLIKEIALEAQAKREECFVGCHREAWPIIQLLPKKYQVRNIDDAGEGIGGKAYVVDLQAAFHFTEKKQVYMTQAYYHTVGRPIPYLPERPELELDESLVECHASVADFGLAPFARSLPPNQRWPKERWQDFVEAFPNRQFLLYGSSHRGDDINLVSGPNVKPYFDHSIEELCLSIRGLRNGLISVSTGPSHIAYAVGTRNYLMINQGAFAKNPDAVSIEDPVSTLSSQRVIDVIRATEAADEQR